MAACWVLCGRVFCISFAFLEGLGPAVRPSHRHTLTTPTGGKPLTSPGTNLMIQPDDARLVPNVLVRGQVLSYRERTAREWEAAMAQGRELA